MGFTKETTGGGGGELSCLAFAWELMLLLFYLQGGVTAVAEDSSH